jgi:hypothetical protein
MRAGLGRYICLLHTLVFLVTLLGACSTLEVGIERSRTAEPPLVEPSLPANSATATPASPSPTSPPAPSSTAQPTPAASSPEEIVAVRADAVIQSLRNKDLEALSTFIHPTKGVRFSPYAFVRDSDRVFTPAQIKGLLADPTPYVWGAYDGSGLPIELTFAEYYDRFVYDQDFAHAEQVGYNQIIGMGNTINNCFEFYPRSIVVEYHFSGFDPGFEGMDWRSLRLVFQEEGGVWYCVGVIHDEWTT